MSDRSLNDLERYLREECLCETGHQCESCGWLQDLIAMRSELVSALAAQATTQDALNRLSARHAVVLQELDKATDDTRRLDWMEQYQPTSDHDGEMLIALVGSWTFNRVRHNEGLRAAIDAAVKGGA